MRLASEGAKLPAFVRRDLRVAASYRFGLAVGLAGLVGQVFAFSFISKLVNPSLLPTYGDTHASYLEFVGIGIAVNVVVFLMLHQLARAIRTEQLIGTLESVLITPIKIATVQIGSALFVLLFVPLRLALFVALIAVLFGLDFHASGILPAVALLMAFLPFVWGLGLIGGAAVLTFRGGMSAVGTGSTLLGLGSGAFFPVTLLPSWLQAIAAWNPMALAITGLREALIGGAGWSALAPTLIKLVALSIPALVAGALFFRLVLGRERRLGTIGLY
ncbi:MAG: ABC transporter permease [Solirubrobacteraceae bacterium]